MAGKQAKILSVDALDSLLAYASSTRHPVRNTAIVLLSVKAGLRAGEIANLTWPMVLDANGGLGSTISLHDKAAKKGSGRSVPMHPQLAEALHAWASQSFGDGYVITSERGGQMTALSIVIWFEKSFRKNRPEGLLVPFWPPDLYHPCRKARSQDRRFIAGCPTACRSCLDPNHPSIHRGDSDAQRRLVGLI